ncbi:MAG: monofunctional biosynthetic peptidoglycan transglycosylase [Rhodospirillaceae bacterium]|nr:monofunctional biosynthetic peptidoglycan transglycosylase [Rhodospirillaceae bacterium]
MPNTTIISRLRKAAIVITLLVLAGPPVALALFRILPVPITPLMIIRRFEGHGLSQDWVSLSNISPQMRAAVIAAEDNRFCRHYGFDFGALQDAVENWDAGRRPRGASTLSMQTAKNLLLWPGRNIVRKALEAYVTIWMEILWPKPRIAEVYLNIAEWGPGIYGAEAAARHHFGISAAHLNRRQAARLAAVLPSPLYWSPSRPTAAIAARARILEHRMTQLGPEFLGCIGGKP